MLKRTMASEASRASFEERGRELVPVSLFVPCPPPPELEVKHAREDACDKWN